MTTSNLVEYDTSEGFETRLERLTSLGTMLSCTIYGAHVAVFLVALKYMIRTSTLFIPQNRLWLALSTLLLACATVSLALQVRWSWGVERMLEDSGSSFNIARIILFMTINWVSDSILLFRFFAIVRRRLTTMILPLVLTMSSIGISSTYHREIAVAYTNSWSDASSTPTIIYLSLSCALNVYLTTHIVFYMMGIGETSTSRITCRRVAAMFVQSTLFCLIPTLVFIVLCARRSLGQNLLFPIVCQIQPLSPLLVIMRVAQHRHLNRDGVVVTTDELLSASAPHRPRLTLKLDFKPRDSSDIEEAESWCETAMVPVSPELPGPLPFVRIKSGPPSAIEMLDSEKMDGLWKSQDSRRASWLISPPPSAPIYLSSCTSSRDDLRAEKFPLHDRPVVEDASNIPYYPPTPPPSDTFYSPSNLSYLPM